MARRELNALRPGKPRREVPFDCGKPRVFYKFDCGKHLCGTPGGAFAGSLQSRLTVLTRVSGPTAKILYPGDFGTSSAGFDTVEDFGAGFTTVPIFGL